MQDILNYIKYNHYGKPITIGIHRYVRCNDCNELAPGVDTLEEHNWGKTHSGVIKRYYSWVKVDDEERDVDIYVLFAHDNHIVEITQDNYDTITNKLWKA